jgi:hypothetical protein
MYVEECEVELVRVIGKAGAASIIRANTFSDQDPL